MNEVAVNVNGKGAMELVTTLAPLKDGAIPAGRDVVFTSGEDGMLMLTDVVTLECISESEICDGFVPSFAVTPEQTHLVIASDEDQTVSLYTFPPKCHREQLVRRSTVSIRQVVCSTNFLVLVEDEPVVRILSRHHLEHVILVEGSTGAIKSVALDPREQFLAVSSDDALVRVYAINAATQIATQVTSWTIQHSNIRHDDVLLRCAWEPAGTVLAVPREKGRVALVAREAWTSMGHLELPIGQNRDSEVDFLAFSTNGQVVAAATCAHEVFVWTLATRTLVRSVKLEYAIQGMQFGKTTNVLVMYHLGGKLAIVQDVMPVNQLLSPSLALKPSHGVEDKAPEDDTSDNDARLEAIKASFGFGRAVSTVDDNDNDKNDKVASIVSPTPSSRLVPFTDTFQPGCVHDASIALLTWTPEGEIEVVRGTNHLIKVTFLDKSRRGFKFHDNYRFSMAFLGDTGAIFGVPRRARDEEDDDNGTTTTESDVIPSWIFYRPFESWAINMSWHAPLPEGEDAVCVASGRDFCAVATSLHTLRIYTCSGVAYGLVRLAGRVVTMSAKDALLAVVYQGLDGPLRYQLVRIQVSSSVERLVLVSKGHVPLTPPPRDVFASEKANDTMYQDGTKWSKLTWLGFDERKILYTVDSFACVQALSKSTGWNWFPIGCVSNALHKKPQDRHGIFTLGVVNDSLLYFPLEKGRQAPTLRGSHRPVPSMFPLRTASFPKTPTTKDDDTINGPMWQNVRLSGLDASSSRDHVVQEEAEMDKALILMMKTACSNDEPARVLDLAKCLHLEKSHQIAQKLAIHFSLRQLQEQLYELYRMRFPEPQQAATPAPYVEEMPAAKQVEPLGRGRSILSRQRSTPEEDETKGPSSPTGASGTKRTKLVERSVAPANPFLVSSESTASSSGFSESKTTGLHRLGKFASPPPVKKLRRSTSKK
ncbi:hypothetical protein PsorP6_013071 [Peronosclerospora sorghi]|uniref:Uncharacterized protein n=1 Tax=Peronosclerospora sorghi TaxID=230839 RepID=A0ACC0WFU8_9STRA|nr:hypothetical protein PsorP6_013071 [Peronosclerospora sorghi]